MNVRTSIGASARFKPRIQTSQGAPAATDSSPATPPFARDRAHRIAGIERLDISDYRTANIWSSSMPAADPRNQSRSAIVEIGAWSRSGLVLIGPGPPRSVRPVSPMCRHRRNVIRSFVGGHRSGCRRKLSPACRRKLRPVLRHAGGDAFDARDLGTAETKCVAGAGLLLLGRVGPCARWQDRCRQHRPHHPNRTPIPGTRNGHRPPLPRKTQ